MSNRYPRPVKPHDVVNHGGRPGMFRIKGGRAVYDEVYMRDGGDAIYLVRIEAHPDGPPHLKITKRQIDWNTKLEQLVSQ